jgi:putative lipoic acid-binding regulatory protein
MSNAPAVPAHPPDLEAVLEIAFENGISDLLKEPGWRGPIVDLLHSETGVSKVYLHLAVRLLAKLAPKAVTGVAKASGPVVGKGLRRVFLLIPGHQAVLAAYGRIDREWASVREFDDVVAGRIPPSAARFADRLPREKRVQFVTMSWLSELRDALNPQPALTLPLEPDTEENRFLFAARRAEFVGRAAEMEALRRFLSSDAPFSYWIVEAPGGAGKSRLGLNLCLEQQGTWRAGFRRSFAQDEWNWEAWKPSVPTLVVADYANEVAEDLGEVVRGLVGRSDAGMLSEKVRILLLVRDSGAEWSSRFLGTGLRRATTERVRHEAPLQISPLTADELWAVLTTYVQPGSVVPPKDQALARLAELDEQGRPLFAAFAGDAISHGHDLRGWDQESLVRGVLEREREHWRRSGVTEHDENLFVLATMTGGLTPAAIPNLPVLPAGGSGSDRFSPDRYRTMSGDRATERLEPMQPDILGELFVLEKLKPGYDGDTAWRPLTESAWSIAPVGMFAFVTRCGADFASHQALPRLLDVHPRAALTRFAWSVAAANLLTFCGSVGRLAEAEALYGQLWELNLAHPDEAALREQQAIGAVNLLTIYGSAGRLADAQARYGELRELSLAHSEEPALRELQAKGAFKLLSAYGSAARLAEAQALYGQLRELSLAHPEPALRESQAKGAFNLLTTYASAGRVAEVEALYRELQELSLAHPDEAALRELQAKGAVNLLRAYGSVGGFAEAEALHGELQELSLAHPDEAALREQQAMGAVNLLTAYGNAGRLPQAQALYEELRALSLAHPEETALREPQAKGAFNLLTAYASAARVAEVDALYRELRELSLAYPDEAALRELQAKGAVNLLGAYGRAGRLAEAQSLFRELQGLSLAHPDEAALRVPHVNGAFNLLTGYASAGRLAEAQALYGQLRDLSMARPDTAALREAQAKGALLLWMLITTSGEIDVETKLGALASDIFEIEEALQGSEVACRVAELLRKAHRFR